MSLFQRVHTAVSPPLAGLLMVAGIGLVGLVDIATGVELHITPLYFVPLSIGAWHLRRTGALFGATLATLAVLLANLAGGLSYSGVHVWAINTLAEAFGFGTVALLIAGARESMDRELRLARTDALTGLANSRAFHEQLSTLAALARRHGHPLTIAYIDLDNFKCVNDRLGHARGDAVLRHVAQSIRATLRHTDLAARMGGDEFVICLPETGETAARGLLERLRLAVVDGLDVAPCAVSASIGAVTWASPPPTVDAMLRGADELMYEAKRGGKNRVRVLTRAAA